eukprot:CAMPEP_0113575648 /NCGR_PEP_ID=MMETSP0015_2-20120614/27817_1 /TAXON_ID=2838 /ORGANISM="Odontella" /LENGTH=248 /DNA_ID=CAMNT_0000478915 /DNA_START=64 /DNA_END=807 /DNA_ORIENTATION=- /assembly_acc=CAM_ASM_000160
MKLNGKVHKCSEAIQHRLAKEMSTNIPRPKQQKDTNTLYCIILCHPLASLQCCLTRLEAEHDLQCLLNAPENHTLLHDITTFPIPTSHVENAIVDTSHVENAIFDIKPSRNPATTIDEPITERVLLPQISILPSCQISSVTGRSLLLVPRTNKASRLPPDPFCITFCRKIRLPLMRHPLQCKYGKMANIYGDHYFDYHHYSKMRVHNQTCDTHCTAFKTIAPYCLIIEDHANVLLETIELSQQHPPKL